MIDSREVASALPWLHGKLDLDEEVNLYYLLGNMRLNQHRFWYKVLRLKDHDGGARIIHCPQDALKLVQERINIHILSKFTRHPSSYGFMGGNCAESDKEHLGFKSVLMFDIQHAFPNTTHQMVFDALYNKGVPNEPYLSFYCARFVADFCTVGNIYRPDEILKEAKLHVSFGGSLPQGSPTSPKLFSLCMKEIDDDLVEVAKRYNLRYTRYADNFYFSSEHEADFPALPRNIILSKVRKHFPVHKVRQSNYGQMCRMLGLNVSPYRLTNTREFKRKLRGALHHLEFMIDHCADFHSAWCVMRGLVGFAIMETLPDKLRTKIAELDEKAQLYNYRW